MCRFCRWYLQSRLDFTKQSPVIHTSAAFKTLTVEIIPICTWTCRILIYLLGFQKIFFLKNNHFWHMAKSYIVATPCNSCIDANNSNYCTLMLHSIAYEKVRTYDSENDATRVQDYFVP